MYIIYKKEKQKGKQVYIHTDEVYKLAGWNWGLIYSLWENKDKPINEGWSVSSSELLNSYNKTYSNNSHSLIIDFDPNSKKRIGLKEIENIHLFTFGKKKSAWWTPMMLELRDVFYKDDYDKELTQEKKQKQISTIVIGPNQNQNVEFLYLHGDDKSWNWGMNGRTNAAFIYDDAREYFKKFF
jgi:hypothetical protein